MNIEEYISSGILEAYALNEISSAEMKEVEQMMATYPEIKEELNAIELAFEGMAMAAKVEPNPALKQSIMDMIDAQEGVAESQPNVSMSSVAVPVASNEEVKSEARVVQMKPSPVWKFAVAASVSLAIISGYLAVDYRTKWKSTNEAFAQLQANNALMADQYNRVNQELEGLEDDFDVLINPDFRRIGLNGTDNAADAYASVYWNTKSQEVYLNIRNLKQLSTDQQYQLWAIIDGKPVDMGVFDWNSEGLIKMKSTGQSMAFAVTIEPKGGSENPSLDTMQVIGNV